ncbi:MAG: twin-arginine translocase subunit TatB [Rhodospirillaceae bacterium]|nr:twin-arginine translocase subunit TatB [Rhodospirillaceae bacterium]
MFDLAWSEIALIVLVAVVVLGPKELPKAMRTVAQFTRKARKLAGEFQGHWNEMVREAELEEVKSAVTKVTSTVTGTNIGSEVEKLIDPSGEFTRELGDTVAKTKQDIESAARIDAPAVSVPTAAPASEPAPAQLAPAPPQQAAQ